MRHNHPTITSYKQASAYLGAKQDRPLPGRSTRLIRLDDSTIAVRYHATYVVTYHANGTLTLNSNGYRTPTTKAKINEYADVRIWQVKGIWQIQGKPFADNCRISRTGKITGLGNARTSANESKLRKQVNAYAKAYIDALFAGKVQAPGAGDCWHCLGVISDSEHIREHIRESYFVPSLLSNAIKVMPVSQVDRWTLAALWTPSDDSAKTIEAFGKFARKDLLSALRRYLYRQLGTAS